VQQVMYLAMCFILATLTVSRELLCLFLLYNKIWNNSGHNMSSSKKISTPQKKFLDSSLVENLEIPVEGKRYFTSSM